MKLIKRLAVLLVILFAVQANALGAGLSQAARVPDLAVTNVDFGPYCYPRITIENKGGPLPANFDEGRIGVWFWVKDRNTGQITTTGGSDLGVLDSEGLLKRQGRVTVSWPWWRVNPGTGPWYIGAYISVLPEGELNTSNNRFQPVARQCGYLPDLKVEDISLTSDCRVKVKVKNIGRGEVPDTAWTDTSPKSPGVLLYVNGKSWGGASIRYFDPHKHLKPPGGTATYVSKLKVYGRTSIKAVVDYWNKISEPDTVLNNAREEVLECGPGGPLPDLEPSGSLKIGKLKRAVNWNQSITLTPKEAVVAGSGGRLAFDIYYEYRENNGGRASGFKNKIYFNSRVVSIQSHQAVGPKEVKQVATQAYIGPQEGELCIKIDAENNIRETNENNNKRCVRVKINRYGQELPIHPGPSLAPQTNKIVQPPRKKPRFVLPREKIQGGAGR